MERLSAGDMRSLAECILRLHERVDLNGFPEHLVGALRGLVPAEFIRYDEINPAAKRFIGVCDSRDATEQIAELSPAFAEHMLEQPTVQRFLRTRDGRAYKVSDLIARGDWHARGVFREFFQPLGVEDMLSVCVPAPAPLIIGLSFARRRRTFTERERAMLNLLRPHLIQAYRNAEAATGLAASLASTREVLEATGAALVAVAPDGKVRLCTTIARLWLERCFPAWRRRQTRLPEAMAHWLNRRRAPVAAHHLPDPNQPLVIDCKGGPLVVRLMHVSGGKDAAGADALLVLMCGSPGRPLAPGGLPTEPAPPDPRLTQLPPRVRPVLERLMLGDSEKEVAATLGLSNHTVHQYIKILYRRFDVSSRGELMARFMPRGSLAPQ
jgi:DNA-binding CsgD family transcriptional regulator